MDRATLRTKIHRPESMLVVYSTFRIKRFIYLFIYSCIDERRYNIIEQSEQDEQITCVLRETTQNPMSDVGSMKMSQVSDILEIINVFNKNARYIVVAQVLRTRD